MGISRSATVVIAYLIATTKMTPHEALATVRARRTIVRPNRGFMSQLQQYHSSHSNSLQAELAAAEGQQRPDKKSSEGKREKQKASWGYNTAALWDFKDVAKSYVHNALNPATFLPSTFRQQHIAARGYWEFERHLS
jgi:hypothetical protein